jgi:hypothetical protein
MKFPRGIHARDDWIKSWIGPIIKEVEKEVYKLPQFVKHIPVPARPRYLIDHVQTAGCVYAQTDYSAFESSFSTLIMNVCEFELLRYMSRNNACNRDVALFCRMCQGENILRYHDGTFVVKARRMSGEMTTSLGNGWTNLMLSTFVMRHRDLRCVVEGDDGLFALQPGDLKYFNESSFADFGFVLKIEIFQEIELASFCGIVFADGVGYNLADPIAELINFGWSLGPLRFNKARDLLVAKALSLAYEYPGAPIISALARAVLRINGTKFNVEYVSHTLDLWKRDQLIEMVAATRRVEVPRLLLAVPVHERSRHVVETKFQVTVQDQLRTEEYLEHHDLNGPLDMPWLVPYVHRDNILMGRHVWHFPAGTPYSKVKTVEPWFIGT